MGQVGGCFLLLRWGNDDTCSPPRGQVCCTRPFPRPSERTRALPGGAQGAECSPGPASRLLTIHASPCLLGLRFSDIREGAGLCDLERYLQLFPSGQAPEGILTHARPWARCWENASMEPPFKWETENTGVGEQGRTASFQGWHVL